MSMLWKSRHKLDKIYREWDVGAEVKADVWLRKWHLKSRDSHRVGEGWWGDYLPFPARESYTESHQESYRSTCYCHYILSDTQMPPMESLLMLLYLLPDSPSPKYNQETQFQVKIIHPEELCEIKQSLKAKEGKQRQDITSTQMISKTRAKKVYTHTKFMGQQPIMDWTFRRQTATQLQKPRVMKSNILPL